MDSPSGLEQSGNSSLISRPHQVDVITFINLAGGAVDAPMRLPLQ